MSSTQSGLRALVPTVGPTVGALLGATLLAGLTGCAAPPSQVLGARHLTVTYWSLKSDRRIILATETDPMYKGLYSQPLDTADIKLAPVEDLKELVRFASAGSFFDKAGNLARPTEALRVRGGYGMIVVKADGQHYSVFLDKATAAANPDLAEDFNEFRGRIRTLYDSIQQLQFIQSKTGPGGNYFEREQERLRRQNRDRVIRKGGNT